jgi:ATP-dependent DNA helicase RecQ
MVTYRPCSADELGHIAGVGAVKLERYGADFLRVLAEHASEHGRPANIPPLPQTPIRTAPVPAPPGRTWEPGLSDTVLETLGLLRSGLPPETIAERRGLKLATIYTHLSRAIEEGELELGEVVTLSEDEVRTIENAFEQLASDSPQALKPVYDALQGNYDYGLLRCVKAAMG